jgi:hypothetical protein
MDVICFLYISLGSSTVQLHYRLVLIVKMATLFEECITEEQRSVMRFYEQKNSMQRTFIKKCVLFPVGSVSRIKRFTTGWQTFR